MSYTTSMSNFIPGKVIKSFTTKSGKSAQLAYPKWEDVQDFLDYINTLSAEDTFVRFSGEQQSLQDEAKYIASTFVDMELHNAVHIICFVEGKFAGYSGINKLPELKKRGEHVGRLGISVSKDFRGEGIGFELITGVIAEAAACINGIKIVHLECTGTNEKALNLYKKVGFKEVGRIPKYILHHGNYEDEVQMVLGVNGWNF